MLLDRDDWYDIAHDVDWSLSYVEHESAFPVEWTGSKNIPHEAWCAWEEPYRVSYRDYVAVQREKEAGVAGVRDALKRARVYQRLPPSVAAVSHLHMGAPCMVEQMAVMMLGRSARFAPSARWRNISVFGMLDEIRHAQLDLLFALAAGAMEAGDIEFSNLLSSIQTDEARHAQQGFPTTRSAPSVCST